MWPKDVAEMTSLINQPSYGCTTNQRFLLVSEAQIRNAPFESLLS